MCNTSLGQIEGPANLWCWLLMVFVLVTDLISADGPSHYLVVGPSLVSGVPHPCILCLTGSWKTSYTC